MFDERLRGFFVLIEWRLKKHLKKNKTFLGQKGLRSKEEKSKSK